MWGRSVAVAVVKDAELDEKRSLAQIRDFIKVDKARRETFYRSHFVLNETFLESNELWEHHVPRCLVHVRFGDMAMNRTTCKRECYRTLSYICRKGRFDRTCYERVVKKMKTFCGGDNFSFISDNSALATFVANGTIEPLDKRTVKHFREAAERGDISMANSDVRTSILDWLRLVRSPRRMSIPSNQSTFFITATFIGAP